MFTKTLIIALVCVAGLQADFQILPIAEPSAPAVRPIPIEIPSGPAQILPIQVPAAPGQILPIQIPTAPVIRPTPIEVPSGPGQILPIQLPSQPGQILPIQIPSRPQVRPIQIPCGTPQQPQPIPIPVPEPEPVPEPIEVPCLIHPGDLTKPIQIPSRPISILPVEVGPAPGVRPINVPQVRPVQINDIIRSLY